MGGRGGGREGGGGVCGREGNTSVLVGRTNTCTLHRREKRTDAAGLARLRRIGAAAARGGGERAQAGTSGSEMRANAGR